ncbi:hypothetical protein GCM10023196_103500 [Actinoallomurus vinaceus]|uniref:Uncharacterized protein n=2 Tax=Actinoallomurus vinaceus TaxID=1080074 RepID=A0ABP8UXN0_9ACTN
MDEIDLLARIGTDVPPLADKARARTRAQILARADRAAADRPNGVDAGRSARFPRARRRMAFRLGLGTIAAAAAAIAVGLPLTNTTPAYAVTKHSDGTVEVVIRQFLYPKKLEATLRENGLRAVVDYVPLGQVCLEPRGLMVPQDTMKVVPLPAARKPANKNTVLRLSPAGLKADETLVIEASFDKSHPDKSSIFRIAVFRGAVAACKPTSTARPAPIMDGPNGPITTPPK